MTQRCVTGVLDKIPGAHFLRLHFEQKNSVHPPEVQRRGSDRLLKYSDKMTGISKAGAPGDILYLQTGAADQQLFCLAEPV